METFEDRRIRESQAVLEWRAEWLKKHPPNYDVVSLTSENIPPYLGILQRQKETQQSLRDSDRFDTCHCEEATCPKKKRQSRLRYLHNKIWDIRAIGASIIFGSRWVQHYALAKTTKDGSLEQVVAFAKMDVNTHVDHGRVEIAESGVFIPNIGKLLHHEHVHSQYIFSWYCLDLLDKAFDLALKHDCKVVRYMAPWYGPKELSWCFSRLANIRTLNAKIWQFAKHHGPWVEWHVDEVKLSALNGRLKDEVVELLLYKKGLPKEVVERIISGVPKFCRQGRDRR